MVDPAPPSSTLVAGKYRLVREIGRGGMGAVWEAQHASLGTRVAIKFIDSSYAESVEARQRFDNEARAAATLRSKHAIQIYDHGTTDDFRPYIVMELLEGEPLDKRIERLGRLSLHETAKILIQVCRGLGKAHELGITHRDLKPENVFLVRHEDDDEEVAKVLDFGIAKMRSADGMTGLTSGTKTGAVLGTPYFMSPEQARGLKEIDHRTDLWSLGIIAYKCVIGVLPFEGQAIGDLLVKICTSPPPIPSRYNHELPPAFDAWFARTMEREPDRRFQTAAELADALALAAGLTPRGRSSFDGGRPVSSMGSPVFNPHQNPAGATAPIISSGPAMSGVPAMSTPSAGYPSHTPGSYPPDVPQPSVHGVAPLPVTGGPGGGPAVTSAPFTTSMYPSGVPRPRRGLAWGLAGMVALCAAGGIGFLMFHQRDVQDRAVEEHEARVANASGSASGAVAGGANGLPSTAGAVVANGSSTTGASTTTATLATADAGPALLQLATPKGTPPVSGDNAGKPGSGHGSHPGKADYGQTPQPLWVPVPVPVPVPTPVAQPAPQPTPQPMPRPYQPAPAQNQRPVTDQSGF